MTVRDLIKILEGYEDQAQVFVWAESDYPHPARLSVETVEEVILTETLEDGSELTTEDYN